MNIISKNYYELAGVTFDTIVEVRGMPELVEAHKDYVFVTCFKKADLISAAKRSGFKISDIPRRKA